MKKVAVLLILSATASAADDMQIPMQRALEFNRWYVNQINGDHFPISDSGRIDTYVTASTMQKLRHAQDPRYADEEYYDADFFTKSQYIGDDWTQNVSIASYDVDPVCVNVIITYGKKNPHTVIDCMVKENGVWKIQSVAARDNN
ncbi:DUF3828 domain-containing protein [Enterobacter cancerogenus]|uniref:DUF3828 domain-containing protein n=1 Tax=Enterobacter cancerogenus TaxID=69218 RepID=UPI0037F5B9D8